MAAFAKSWQWDSRRGASRAGNSATVDSPGPAPKTIIALSSGWLAIRPRWIVHKGYSGPWRPPRGGHPPRSRSPPKWTGGHNRERDPDKRSSGGPGSPFCLVEQGYGATNVPMQVSSSNSFISLSMTSSPRSGSGKTTTGSRNFGSAISRDRLATRP
jgi:hypothetical protein